LDSTQPVAWRWDRQTNSTTRIVSILSGKGGVGKTIIACNLAERTASLGYRVLLVDADYSFGNVHILTNANCDYGVGSFASGRLSLREASITIAERLDILASESNNDTKQLYDVKAATALVDKLRRQATDYDLVLIDHGSGKSDSATAMAVASDLSILVVIPELTSLSDGYGLLKQLTLRDSNINCSLLINRAESADEADYVRSKFASVAARFLNLTPPFMGYLPEDTMVKESVSRQRLVAAVDGDSKAARSFTGISRSLVEWLRLQIEGRRLAAEKRINENQTLADIRE